MSKPDGSVLVRIENLKKHFPVRIGAYAEQKATVQAVNGISFNIYKGETLGLVGECWLWQINCRANHPATLSANVRKGLLSGYRPDPIRRKTTSVASPKNADHFSGSIFYLESPDDSGSGYCRTHAGSSSCAQKQTGRQSG